MRSTFLHILPLVVALLAARVARADDAGSSDESRVAVMFGLLLPYASQPGGQFAVELTLARPAHNAAVVLIPRGGVYTRPESFVSGLAGVDFGVTLGRHLPARHQITVGGAYLPTGDITLVSIDLGTGAQTPTYTPRHRGLVDLRYTFQHMPGPVGWWFSLEVGRTITGTITSDAFWLSLGLGVRIEVGP